MANIKIPAPRNNPLTVKNKKAFLNKFESNSFHIANTCKSVGIDRQTYYMWIKNDPEFKIEMDVLVEKINDDIEKTLVSKAKEGNTDLIKFWAKTKMKHRGFAEDPEQATHVTAINITFEKAVDEPKIIDQE
jgi:hypothetical protein